MTPERYRRAQELFALTLAEEESKRPGFLAGACGPDDELRREVESLLASHEAASDGFLRSGTLEIPPSMAESVARAGAGPRSLAPETRLGAYEIVSRIGAGGMGEVYRARDPKLEREVAIKVLAPSLAEDPEALSRFEREARAVAALSHPNILSIFDFGREGSIAYAVTELLEGQTLREKLQAKGAMAFADLLEYATQILSGLSAAHEKGIVHRDLKPDNVFLTEDGRIKVLDFGLAKRSPLVAKDKETSAPTVTGHTTPGTIMGTLGYMSPEQLLGQTVDPRSDLFSFGVVMYELSTGQLPFVGNSGVAVADAILHAPPRSFGNARVPERWKAVVRKLLSKEPAKRFESARELRNEIERVRLEMDPARRRRTRAARIAVAAVLVVGIPAAVWFWRRSSQERWAHEVATPEIARLVEAGKNREAAVLAIKALAIVPKDPTLKKLWTKATGEATVTSVPPGAEVSIRPYDGDPNVWERIGTTPFKKIRVPDSLSVWRIAKPGFTIVYLLDSTPSKQEWTLRPTGAVPPSMTIVLSDETSVPYPFVGSPTVKIPEFLIDRTEVTNEEYRKFVDAGGYRDRKYWKEPFVRNGVEVSWETAIATFRDATGRTGPATWETETFPRGHEKYPVAGVSWFEAAAYAEFVHKSLPTAHQWILASENDNWAAEIVSASNFRGAGPQPVASPGTLSGFGTFDMAGNVKEWCWNATRGGDRITYGGGFGEPSYMFTQPHQENPWDRRSNFGFRCVRNDVTLPAAATAELDPIEIDFYAQKPVSDEVFATFKELYTYDKEALNAKIEETRDFPDWKYERVSYAAAYGGERVPAYLLLPKNSKPPYQTAVWFPGGNAMFSDKFDPAGFEELGFFPRSGRAVLIPIYKSTYERKDEFKAGWGFEHPAAWRDHMQLWSKDLGRSLDYLQTRSDIDSSKVAYYGFSWGSGLAAVLLAVEDRFKTAILVSGGFWVTHRLPQVDPINFVSHIKIPVLMLNERYDTYFPLAASQRPFFQLLGTRPADKRQVLYDTGHANAPTREIVRESLDWLDKYLGPVRR